MSLRVFDYKIPGTKNKCDCQPSLEYQNFEDSYHEFKDDIHTLVKNGENKTFYKFTDGEYFWLTNHQVGSVSPGKRDSNVSNRDLTPFREGVLKCDYHGMNLHPHDYKNFKKIFNKEPDFLCDYVVGMVYNKWFTETFDGEIGLIGADVKLDLIKELCGKQEYLDYLKFNGFTDYIKMPQRYLCDQIDYADELLEKQLSKSKSKIFLIGIGHAGMALMHRMQKYTDAIFINVGSGICAYAGVQDNDRPYAADWVNYQLNNFDYSKVDVWKNNMWNKKII